MNMFGVTLGTYNKFEEIYKFAHRTMNTAQGCVSNLKEQLDEETYIKQMQEAVEQAKRTNNSDISRSDIGRDDLENDDFEQMYNNQNR